MEKDMTKGSPARILIFFTLPMLIGNLFQQLYNIVDTIVVGNFVGAGALASVGASTTLVFLLLCFAIGLSMGCSVLVSQYYGAGETQKMRQAVFVSMVFILVVGALLSVFGVIGADWLLSITNVPVEILADAKTYFVVYCFGGLFVFIYNALAAMCRAIGDSKTPLYFLIATSLLNIVGDLLFVLQFGMGVAGVAWATMISQGISALACGIYVFCRVPALKITRSDCVFSWRMLWDLVVYAVPSTIQQSIVSFSLVAVQGLVNTFGMTTIAGYTAACKIDQFAIQPLLSLNLATTSFTAQNVGAQKYDRVEKGFRTSVLLVVAICVVISGAIWLWGADLIGLFVDNVESAGVIDAGVSYIRVVSVCYIIMGMMFTAASVLRGAGDMGYFLVGSLLNFSARIIAAYSLASALGFSAIAYSIPIGWILGLTFNFLRYKSGGWKDKALVQKA